MASCSQCQKRAVASIAGGISVCVDCLLKFQQAAQIRDNMLKQQINFLMDQAEAASGLYGISPRYELPSPLVNQGAVNFHNIKVERSVVGAINTGEVQRIDVA